MFFGFELRVYYVLCKHAHCACGTHTVHVARSLRMWHAHCACGTLTAHVARILSWKHCWMLVVWLRGILVPIWPSDSMYVFEFLYTMTWGLAVVHRRSIHMIACIHMFASMQMFAFMHMFVSIHMFASIHIFMPWPLCHVYSYMNIKSIVCMRISFIACKVSHTAWAYMSPVMIRACLHTYIHTYVHEYTHTYGRRKWSL